MKTEECLSKYFINSWSDDVTVNDDMASGDTSVHSKEWGSKKKKKKQILLLFFKMCLTFQTLKRIQLTSLLNIHPCATAPEHIKNY